MNRTPDAPNPFLDPAVRPGLYAEAGRLTSRTSALHRAKSEGRPVADAIVDLALRHAAVTRAAIVLDLGCGRGTTTRALAERLRPAQLLGVDASAALLSRARTRTGAANETTRISWLCADFHHLPLPTASSALAVAAFCLYHSPTPRAVVEEMARCLVPGGTALLVTKSADSYRELDRLVAAAGLDPDAERRPSLYTAAHSGNLTQLAEGPLRVVHTEHEIHRFTFSGHAHLAEYLATTPKYNVPDHLATDPVALADSLSMALPDRPVTTVSTVTYVVATRPEETT
ncbi:class I SAM-dependent methyltransferase [Allostreptomyces psammosilenae]|uniref:SAM-dependent methyltransferase n=1 Tax=Allostreptomyces psammosilenae TaxID=1892865 RepID=A0A852ZUG3_9ACTN|nr:class I SAM-dependent methyltransferase [Allostreptomyces psammosilenae]NYI05545.1 SAM-dependent methyltransferase [Allostreptomyces psammosilenae]